MFLLAVRVLSHNIVITGRGPKALPWLLCLVPLRLGYVSLKVERTDNIKTQNLSSKILENFSLKYADVALLCTVEEQQQEENNTKRAQQRYEMALNHPQPLFPNQGMMWDNDPSFAAPDRVSSPTLPQYSPTGAYPQMPPQPQQQVHQRKQSLQRSDGGERGAAGIGSGRVGGQLFDDFGAQDFIHSVTDNPLAQMGLAYGSQWAATLASDKYKQGVRTITNCK